MMEVPFGIIRLDQESLIEINQNRESHLYCFRSFSEEAKTKSARTVNDFVSLIRTRSERRKLFEEWLDEHDPNWHWRYEEIETIDDLIAVQLYLVFSVPEVAVLFRLNFA